MPAKTKWWWSSTTKVKKKVEEKPIEVEVTTTPWEIEEEIPVSTVIENEINDDEIPAGTVFEEEEEIFVNKSKSWTRFKANQVSWDVWWTFVTKPQWRIRFEAQVAPFPMFMLPEELRRWLISNWLTTDVYKKDKEWLEKHKVDMKMVEKLKKFLTERF